ncbi:MAG TPA: hypothetical protein VMW88_01595, partial [Thermoplasmata archaeon]|nr:hypothetical protein [Thermoplasmata archaeon]
MDDNSQDAAHSIRRERVFGRRLLAFATVMIMVSTAFVALNVGATGDPMIWTSQDEYGPGEVVPIYGQGFAAFEDIVVEISHPDFDDRLYTVKPDVYGKFAFSEYVAEWVTSQDIPVNVTATQVVLGQTLVAYTEFFDPAAYIEGFTLKPVQRFTTGDIKGYNEGDSIPMIVVLNRNQLGGGSTVTVEIGFDYADINSPTNPIHGIDYLTGYNKNPPTPPYNTYPETTLPFWVSPSEGNLTDQHFVGYQDEVPSEGDNQQIGVWEFTLVFYANVQYAKVRFGAHLSVTDLSASFLGSSYFPGSALHVRLVSIDPSADEGNRDVPIALGDLLTPPQLTLEKSCAPTEVVYGDEITFEITWSNIGQAYANCIVLWDILPDQIDLDTSSFLMWTSVNPTKMTPVPGPVVYGGDWFEWLLGPMRGTGTDSALDPLVIHLSFTGTVNTGEEGCYENWAYLSYSDDHGGEFPDLEAYCTFCIKGQPEIEVEKTGPEYAHYGDTIEYTYTVTNTGEVDLVDVDVEDDVLGTIAEDDTLDVGETKTYTVYHTVTVSDDDPLVNNVVATGEDDYYRVVTDEDCWSVDILDPEITVTKDADLYCGEVGETIWYTIVVSNPSDDTDLYNVVVDDSLLGLLLDQGTLLAKQSKEFVVSFDVTEDFGDPMVNEVTATGEDLLGLEVSDYDSVDVDIKHPAIEITKEGSMECGIVGETVTYWIN